MRAMWVLVCVFGVACAAGDGQSERSGSANPGNSMGIGGGAGDGADGMGAIPGGDPGMPGGPGGPGDPGVTPGDGMPGDGMLTPIEKTIMEGEECDLVTQQADNGKQPVDIIWAIDSSPSMSAVIAGIQMEMNNLVNTVTMADIDVKIILISGLWRESPIFNNQPEVGNPVICIEPPIGSGDCGNDSKPPTYHHVTSCPGGDGPLGCAVSSHGALGRLQSAYPAYQDLLRPDSLKYFGAVTDDTAGDTNDFAGQAAMFTAWVDTQGFTDWKFFGIINPSLGGAYQMLADQTGGMTGEISLIPQDYTMMFNMLAITVTNEVKLACDWEIPTVTGDMGAFDKFKTNFSYSPGDGSPAPEVFHVDTVGDCGMEHGWYYDNNDAPQKVVVCPKTCATVQPDLMGKVDILFGCTTLDRPD